MTSTHKTRRVYSAEELHRLRGAHSHPQLLEAIEKHDGEDAELVKEHVLRGSRSFAARSFRSRPSMAALRVPSNKTNDENASLKPTNAKRDFSSENAASLVPVLGEVASNGQLIRPGPHKLRPSPTPSLKKKKAEAIVKAHGSPTHIRVTAGGRIVPSEQSPLCFPRYGYSAIKQNGGLIKFAPNYHGGPVQWHQATENGFVAQDVHGNLCQIVNGTILPLNEIDGVLRLYMHAPNLKITQRGSSLGPIPSTSNQPGLPQHSPTQTANANFTEEPSTSSQIAGLDLEYSKLEHELKDVDKTEVIHGRSMGKVAKEALVFRRRELVIKMDKLRKGIKELKNPAPANAPTSPRAMLKNHDFASSPRGRLPAFLNPQPQAHATQDYMPPEYPPVFNGSHPPPFIAHGTRQAAGNAEAYESQPWIMPPAPMFVPPPFDGPTAPLFPCLLQAMNTTLSLQQTTQPAMGQPISQHDGSQSLTDNPPPMNRSHAVSIKAPTSIRTTSLKSTLNPMSPVYKPASKSVQAVDTPQNQPAKPVVNRVPTPLSPLQQLRSNGPIQDKVKSSMTDTTSPVKKDTHPHSSSVSSFETADFFPRNTREYSTRQHAYLFQADSSEDKENVGPEQHAYAQASSPLVPEPAHVGKNTRVTLSEMVFNDDSPPNDDSKPPASPPGTPTHNDNYVAKRAGKAADTISGLHNPGSDNVPLPDRGAHNVSPKNRRGFLFLEEYPENASAVPVSSPCLDACRDELCVINSPTKVIDFTQKPREWIEGYQAGLQRRSVGGDRSSEFMDGYCSGLLKSKPSSTRPSPSAHSTGSPVKANDRRTSPVMSRCFSQPINKMINAGREPFEMNQTSIDTFRQAVFSSPNENAILTPAADGPHVNDPPFHLGAWKRHQPAAPDCVTFDPAPQSGNFMAVPSESSAPKGAPRNNETGHMRSEMPSLTKQHATVSAYPHPSSAKHLSDQAPQVPTHGAESIDSQICGANRISSITSLDSAVYRPWPGHRIISPHLEWKSASSVAHAASLAAGLFANAQFDGTPNTQHRTMSFAGSGQIAPAWKPQHSRFREGSLDGITSSPASPVPTASPPTSPRTLTPAKSGVGKKGAAGSPHKGPSPAKAKFEHIAEKVGIKVSSSHHGNPTNKPSSAHSHDDPSATLVAAGSNTSPPGNNKRRWRDVWRGGVAKKDGQSEHT